MVRLPRISRIAIDISVHCVITLSIAAAIYLHSHNITYVLIFIAGGIFIDLDHFIDYFIYHKGELNMVKFVRCTYLKSEKVYVVLHSWELNLCVFAVAIATASVELFMLGISLAIHFLIDGVQRKDRFFYFLIYRISKRFDAKVLLPEFSCV
jgi:hypothetical protein